MLNAILSLFGLGKRPGTGPTRSPRYTRRNVKPANYYRRGGNYYRVDDDSLIEDIILLDILAEYFDDGLITEAYEDPAIGNIDSVEVAPEPEVGEVDIFEVDVDSIPVVEAAPTPEPEPVKTSYSSGYSDGGDYSSSDSSYDSGGSDD